MIKDFYDGMTLDEIYTKRIKYNSPVLERLSTLESILKNIKVQFTGNYNDLTNKPDLTIYAINSEVQDQLDSLGVSISDIESEISDSINVELSRLETDKVDYEEGNINLPENKTYKINDEDVIGDKAKVDASNLNSDDVLAWQNKLSNKIADFTTTSLTNSFTMSGLDLQGDGGEYEIIFIGAVNGSVTDEYHMRFNGNSTANYRRILINSASSVTNPTAEGSSNGTSYYAGILDSEYSYGRFILTMSGSSRVYVKADSTAKSSTGGTFYLRNSMGLKDLGSNLTSITFFSLNGNNFTVGTRVIITKRGI